VEGRLKTSETATEGQVKGRGQRLMILSNFDKILPPTKQTNDGTGNRPTHNKVRAAESSARRALERESVKRRTGEW
jgi:hypothetical protein